MDFQRIVEDQEIKMSVPIHFIGEDVAPGVKQGGGKVSHLMNDVEVVCLPKHLPEYLEVDVSELELDDMLSSPTSSCRKAFRFRPWPRVRSRPPGRFYPRHQGSCHRGRGRARARCSACCWRAKTRLAEASDELATTTPTTSSPVIMLREKTAVWRSFCF